MLLQHSLAVLLAMPETKNPTTGDAVGIGCLTSSEMKQPVPEDVPIGRVQ